MSLQIHTYSAYLTARVLFATPIYIYTTEHHSIRDIYSPIYSPKYTPITLESAIVIAATDFHSGYYFKSAHECYPTSVDYS